MGTDEKIMALDITTPEKSSLPEDMQKYLNLCEEKTWDDPKCNFGFLSRTRAIQDFHSLLQ